MSNSHPLDETFDMDSAEDVEDVFGMNLELPDNPNMTAVVNFALQQYKKIIENSELYEPEDRLSMLQIAKEYLDLAKDTMYKESDLAIKSRKNDIQEKRVNPKQIPNDSGNGDDNDNQKVLSYDQVMEDVAKKKREMSK